MNDSLVKCKQYQVKLFIMSDNISKIIPSLPDYVPDEDFINQAVSVIRVIFPDAEDIKVIVTETTRYIDSGTNQGRIVCPNCKALIAAAWWQHAVDEAFDKAIWDLSVTVPCCYTDISLNDLVYEWPVGFAKFSIEVWNPKMDIPTGALEQLKKILRVSLRVIWAHY